jgi:hypothetical protein
MNTVKIPLSNKKAFETFTPHGDVVEVRILNAYGNNKAWDGFAKGVVTGYFDNHDSFCKAVREANGADQNGIYFTPQKIDSRLLGRAFNRLKATNITTSDNNVLAYRFLLIDLDPVRPSGISASDKELQYARDTARKVVSWLSEQGFPEPIHAMSGNGFHLLYKIEDMPITDSAISFVKGFLNLLADHFNTELVTIDTTVFNPGRICRLYGTTTRKGDSVPPGLNREARPHRQSYIEKLPEPLHAVSERVLENIKKLFPQEEQATVQTSDNYSSKLDVARYLNHYRIKHRVRQKNGATFFCLDSCVFDESHKGNESAIIQKNEGKLMYQCFHNSCQGRYWKEARELISGGDKLVSFLNGVQTSEKNLLNR